MSATLLVFSLNPTLQKTTLFPGGWNRGEVNRSSEYSLTVSGKGANTARILAQLEESVAYLTQLGGRNRDFFLEEMRKEGVKLFWDDSESEIRYCQTLISGNPFDVTEIIEEGEPVSEQTDRSIRDHFTEAMSIADWLLIVGSKAPGFSDNIYLDCAKQAHDSGIPLILDLHGPDLQKMMDFSPRLVKINAFEFLQSFLPEEKSSQHISAEQTSLIKEKAAALSAGGIDLVITNGAEELILAEKGRVESLLPPKMELVNPIGCGDAMTAGIAAGLRRNLSTRQALDLGLDCAKKNGANSAPGTIL